ncbi:MAG: RdgB/HAM1 family non-canonical purine NTP pyrophosphatase [Planctomycetota bacterium]
MFDLVLGTGNAKKLVELRMMLPTDTIRLTSLAELENAIEVVEDGATFEDNASLKACQQAKHLGRWVLAEDSGLAVDAIQGRPGVYSARYAGKHGDDAANNEKLLRELRDVPAEKRGAGFHCHLCLSDPNGKVVLTESGVCRGRIAESAVGTAGFGYDPLFVVREYHRTFGVLDLTVKRAISHRSRALRRFIPRLLQLIASRS